MSYHLRLLSALELYMNSKYYSNHPKFTDLHNIEDSVFSEATLFTICLTTSGLSAWDNSKDRLKAVQADARGACKTGEWSAMFNLMALCNVLGRPIFSVYPNVSFAVRAIIHGILQPRIKHQGVHSESMVYIMWSRDGNLDTRSGSWFEPNHFVPLAEGEPTNNTNSNSGKKMSSDKEMKITNLFFKAGSKRKGDVSQDQTADIKKTSQSSMREKSQHLSKGSDIDKRKPARKVTCATVDRWKTMDDLAVYDLRVWFTYEEENAETVNGRKYCAVLKCKVCEEFEDVIKDRHNFSRSWIDGSTNFKISNVVDHAKAEAHQVALSLFKKRSGMMGKRPVTEKNQRPLEFIVNPQQLQDLKKKFDVAYFIVKEELPLSKYEKIVGLEKRHGVPHNKTYSNRTAATEFISIQADQLKEQLSRDIAQAKFYSILFDGTTDCSVIEQEAVFALYFDPEETEQPNEEEPMVRVKMAFISLQNLENSCAEGVVAGIKQSLTCLGLNSIGERPPVHVGLGGDGCSTNRGEKGGVKAILKQEFPWFLFVWCVAHRLELSLKDALSSTYFKEVDDCLLRLYYLHEKSPKKLRGLEELHNTYKHCMEFVEGSLKPKRASGTRWIMHKVSALRLLIDKFGIYMQHVESCSVDKSVKPKDQAKLRGYLRKWKTGKMFMYSCFFVDLLQSSASLSAAFQDEDVDAVSVTLAMNKAKQQLAELRAKDPDKLRTVRFYLSKVEEDSYQGVCLPGLQTAIDHLKKNSTHYVDLIRCAIENRLDGEDDISDIAKVLNCQVWSGDYLEDEDTDKIVLRFVNQFQDPLRQQGFQATELEVLEEWHDVVNYTLTYLKPSAHHHRAVWFKIFHSSQLVKWQNILLLVRLLFTLPVSNAAVERFFSTLKRVKSAKRSSLAQKTIQDIMRITTEGLPLEDYDPTEAVNAWSNAKQRRPNQHTRKVYKKRASNKTSIPESSDSESTDDVGNTPTELRML